MSYVMDVSFLNKGKHLWDKNVMKGMFKEFKNFQDENEEESKERCFVEFMLEMEQAYKTFLDKISDLPLIMNCRTKCDDKSHFGGMECAALMKAFRACADKYLHETSYCSQGPEGTVFYVVNLIRSRAKEDEKYAWDVEKRVRQDYDFLGIDNTFDIFEESKY